MKVDFFSLKDTHNELKLDYIDALSNIIDSSNYILGDNLKNFEAFLIIFGLI